MRFWIRAYDWYKASKPQHAWESCIRPVELRYDDLLDHIESCAKEVETLATVAARAEQRDVHVEILELARRTQNSERILSEVRQLILGKSARSCPKSPVLTLHCEARPSMQSGSEIDTNATVTVVQRDEVIKAVSAACRSDFMSNFRYSMFMARHNAGQARAASLQVWHHPKFERWNSKALSTVLAIKGHYFHRFHRGICVSMIATLRINHVPVIWALRPAKVNPDRPVTTSDLIRDLIHQALMITSQTEKTMAQILARFHTAKSDEGWLDLLVSILSGIQGVYLVVDTAAAMPGNTFSWITAFQKVLSKLWEHNATTTIKVLLMGYGTEPSGHGSEPDLADITVSIRQLGRLHSRSQNPSLRGGTNLARRRGMGG